MTRATFVVCATALAVCASAAPAAAHSDAVATWNANAGKAAVAACISPVGPSPAEARRRASPDAAVAAAARDVLVPTLSELSALVPPACVDAAVASVEGDYAGALAEIPDGRREARGVAVGRAAAAAILALRASDGNRDLLVLPTSRIPRARRPARTASRRERRLRSRPDSAVSRRSCCGTAGNSAPGRRMQ